MFAERLAFVPPLSFSFPHVWVQVSVTTEPLFSLVLQTVLQLWG